MCRPSCHAGPLHPKNTQWSKGVDAIRDCGAAAGHLADNVVNIGSTRADCVSAGTVRMEAWGSRPPRSWAGTKLDTLKRWPEKRLPFRLLHPNPPVPRIADLTGPLAVDPRWPGFPLVFGCYPMRADILGTAGQTHTLLGRPWKRSRRCEAIRGAPWLLKRVSKRCFQRHIISLCNRDTLKLTFPARAIESAVNSYLGSTNS
jgi:hypothetical protein